MIRIPYDELGKMTFQQSVQKLANSTFKSPKAFAVKHITKALREGFFKMREDYQKNIEEKYAVKTDGKVTNPAEGTKAAELQLPFAVKEGTEGDAKGALDTFGKTIFTIDKKKLTSEVLFEVNEWSPRELEALEPIIEEPTDHA